MERDEVGKDQLKQEEEELVVLKLCFMLTFYINFYGFVCLGECI